MRSYADCRICRFKHRVSKCLPCTAGENFEPEEVEGLNFDKVPTEFMELTDDE